VEQTDVSITQTENMNTRSRALLVPSCVCFLRSLCPFACALLAMIGGCASQPRSKAVPPPQSFLIQCEDPGQPVMDGLIATADAAMVEYRRLVPDAKPLREPIPVRVFKTYDAALPYLRAILDAGAPEFAIRRGGFVLPHFGIVVINPAVDAQRANLAHEGFHAFAQQTFARRVPPFIEEGVASMFEGLRVEAPGEVVFNPRRHPRREAELYKQVREGTLRPIDTMLSLNAADYLRDRPGDAEVFYAHAWAFALYLDTQAAQDGSGKTVLRAMLADGATGKPVLDGANSRDAWQLVAHYSGEPREATEAGFKRFVTQVIAPRGAP
jgi:hypothetical protein